MSQPTFKNLSLERRGDVFILTMQKAPPKTVSTQPFVEK